MQMSTLLFQKFEEKGQRPGEGKKPDCQGTTLSHEWLNISKENFKLIAGWPDSGQCRDGKGMNARFKKPRGIAFDLNDDLIVVDTTSNKIRMINHECEVTSIAGMSIFGFRDGPCDTALFMNPTGVAVDSANNIVVVDNANESIRFIERKTQQVWTLAGISGKPGHKDGRWDVAQFHAPSRACIDKKGNIFIADRFNHCIRQIDGDGMVSTIAGTPTQAGRTDGFHSEFNEPIGLVIDRDNNIVVADMGNNAVRKILPTGAVETIARGLSRPRDIAIDNDGRIFVLTDKNLVCLHGPEHKESSTMCEMLANGLSLSSNGSLYFSQTSQAQIHALEKKKSLTCSLDIQNALNETFLNLAEDGINVPQPVVDIIGSYVNWRVVGKVTCPKHFVNKAWNR